MPNNKIYSPGHPSLASRLNAQIRAGTAGNTKTNRDEVRLFKQRIRDGMDPDAAREGTKITARMAVDIKGGRTWASVILLVIALCTMGSSCDGRGSGPDQDRAFCWDYDYPLCSEVSSTYPCLCLYGSEAVTSLEDEHELYNATPTPGYTFQGGYEGGATEGIF